MPLFLPRFLLSPMVLLLLHASSLADIVAEHALPLHAMTWFNTLAGISTDGAIIDRRKAQVFIPLSTGILDDVSFSASRESLTNVDLRISIATVESGAPGTILGSTLLPFPQVGTTSLSGVPIRAYSHTVDFTGNILLEAGTAYALVFSTDTPEAMYRLYGDNSGYAGGSLLYFQSPDFWDPNPGDLIFKVRTVPEPSAAAMIGFAGLLAGTARRRAPRTSPRSSAELSDGHGRSSTLTQKQTRVPEWKLSLG